MSPITTHVLDTARGKPAQGVPVLLERLAGPAWKELSKKSTNEDGRVADLLADGTKLDPGTYRLTFDTAAYFKGLKTKTFYPSVAVVFEISDLAHYHVPLLLSPFGYSTYRGS